MNSYRKWVPLIIAALVVAPVVVIFMTSVDLIPVNTSNDWIGFWGSYLGAILGGTITLCVLYITIEQNRKDSTKNEKNNYCMQLIDLVSEYEGAICKLSISNVKLWNSIRAGNKINIGNYRESALYYNAEARKISVKLEIFLGIGERKGLYEGIEVLQKIITEIDGLISGSTSLLDGEITAISILVVEIAQENDQKSILKREELFDQVKSFVVKNTK